ncbi:MAG: 5-(carboxyamino)imidazole ribonucleotide synthase [Cyanobacteria bacterium J06648_10]
MAKRPRVRRVGVIGGGQLAWMMSTGATELGLELWVQTPNESDPAAAIAHKTILGPVADATITAQLTAHCNVITFENEFIDLPALRKLEEDGTVFYPQLNCLAPLLDKYDQRQYCDRINLPSPPFATLHSKADRPQLTDKVNAVGLPLALKTRRHGYDGQGTFILNTLEAVESTWQTLGYQPVLLEAFVKFEKELAVMVARSQAGEIAVYPVVETEQIEQVCRRVIAPARVSEKVAEEVRRIATQLVDSLGVVGIFGIELFLTADGQVLINEIAPRTHNSGHYTLDACETSQFEQQLRAVSGRSLGSVAMTSPGAVMVNLLGTENTPAGETSEYLESRNAIAALPNTHLYWYGKTQSRIGRKLAHVTVLTDGSNDDGTIAEIVRSIESLWYEP